MSVWEERWHPLGEEWVIVAAHRQNRPWIGEMVGRRTHWAPAAGVLRLPPGAAAFGHLRLVPRATLETP